jgi:uncharacterized membrane protein YhhN
MLLSVIYSLSLVLLVALLTAKRYASGWGVWLSKPVLSLLFVIVAILQIATWSDFHLFMLAGFVLCFLGDVFLIPEGNRMFLVGLVSFLVGHLLYIMAFYQIALLDSFLILPGLVILLVDAAVYTWLKEHIQEMKGPVLIYMLVISIMVLAACAVATNGDIASPGRILILGGAISFFVSDLFVVREQFVHKSFANAALGLPLYYGGQIALAISLGYVI